MAKLVNMNMKTWHLNSISTFFFTIKNNVNYLITHSLSHTHTTTLERSSALPLSSQRHLPAMLLLLQLNTLTFCTVIWLTLFYCVQAERTTRLSPVSLIKPTRVNMHRSWSNLAAKVHVSNPRTSYILIRAGQRMHKHSLGLIKTNHG